MGLGTRGYEYIIKMKQSVSSLWFNTAYIKLTKLQNDVSK